MAHISNGSVWWHWAEPFIAPAFNILGPLALHAILRWYATRAKPKMLTRRERLLVWAIALATVWSVGLDAGRAHKRDLKIG